MSDPNAHRLDPVPDELDRCTCRHYYVDHDDTGCIECDCPRFEARDEDPGDQQWEPSPRDDYGRMP